MFVCLSFECVCLPFSYLSWHSDHSSIPAVTYFKMLSSKQIHTVVPWDMTSWRDNVCETHPCWRFSVVIKHHDPRWLMDERVYSGLWFRRDPSYRKAWQQLTGKEEGTENQELTSQPVGTKQREWTGRWRDYTLWKPTTPYFLWASVPLLNFPDSITSWNQVFRFETFLIWATIHVLWYCFCWWASFQGVQRSCVSFHRMGREEPLHFLCHICISESPGAHMSLCREALLTLAQ